MVSLGVELGAQTSSSTGGRHWTYGPCFAHATRVRVGDGCRARRTLDVGASVTWVIASGLD
jgi:hypothetical protein